MIIMIMIMMMMIIIIISDCGDTVLDAFCALTFVDRITLCRFCIYHKLLCAKHLYYIVYTQYFRPRAYFINLNYVNM